MEQDQLRCGSTGNSSGNCRETEVCMVWACHAPRQPLQNHFSGHHGKWATPWSAEEMLDKQRQRVDIPTYARTAHNGLPQKRLEKNFCWIVPHVPLTIQWDKEQNRTDHAMTDDDDNGWCFGGPFWDFHRAADHAVVPITVCNYHGVVTITVFRNCSAYGFAE